MTDEVTLSERSLRRNISNAELRRLLCLQNALVFFNTSLQGNDSIIGKIRHVFPDNFDNDLLEDVEIEIRQALGTIAIYTDILEATMDTYSSLISNNTNDVMKRMTAITIVLMIPTLIASFYGMNVPLGVENSRYAFPIIHPGGHSAVSRLRPPAEAHPLALTTARAPGMPPAHDNVPAG